MMLLHGKSLGRVQRGIGVAFGFALFSVSLQAQSDGTERITDARARTAIQRVLRNSEAKGVPVEPLIKKVREGVNKQAEPSRIQSAVQLMAERLETSAKALTPIVEPDELSSGANALAVGVSASTLRSLRAISPGRSLRLPLDVLSVLVEQRVPVSMAAKHVRDLVAKGATNTQLVALGENVKSDVSAGMTPAAAMDLRSMGVNSLLTDQLTQSGVLPAIPPKPPIRPKK